MFRRIMTLAATAGALAMATAAAAAPIVYTGSKTVSNGTGSITATYSITTDGTTGAGVDAGKHVTSFNITLADAVSQYSYNHTTNGGTGSIYGSFTASATDLRIGIFDAGLMSNSNTLTALGQPLGLFNVSSIGATAQISDAAHTTYVSVLDFTNGTKPFAFAAATALPEATTWAMMIVGVGAIGFAMRRQRVRATVRFA